jgi:riboflavin kinase / FMN adenylyltransferase
MSFGWPEDAPERFALTIGVFDGVHVGHQRIVARSKRLAEAAGAPALALTFDRPPEEIVAPERVQPHLTTLPRRIALLRQAGADEVIVLGFDRELASESARSFSAELLGSRDIVGVVIGANFRFGRGGKGDAATLERAGAKRGVEVVEEPLLVVDGAPVSSTRIRQALLEGDVGAAARMLGREPEIEGIVVSGTGRGQTLGYPTANLSVEPDLLVGADGVYAGRALFAGGEALAAISIGRNPTFGGHCRAVEAYLLDLSEDLLGRELRLQLVARLRDQQRFASMEELTVAIGEDVAATRRVLLAGG